MLEKGSSPVVSVSIVMHSIGESKGTKVMLILSPPMPVRNGNSRCDWEQWYGVRPRHRHPTYG